MKKFIIAILLLVLIGVGSLIFAVSRAGSIVSEYKPELEQLASDSLGSTVTLGELSVSLFPNASVVIDSAKVANVVNPEETITVEQVSLSLKIIPLLSGNIAITELDIIAPNITIVREAEGIFIEGLPKADSSKEPAVESESDPVDPEIPVTIDLQSFNLKNASLLWKNTIGEMDYTVEELNLSASFNFAEKQAVFSNVDGGGTFMETIDFTYSGNGLRYGLNDGIIALDTLTAASLGSTINVNGELSQNDADKKITISSIDGVVLDEMQPLFEIFAPAAIEFGVKGSIKPNVEFAFTPSGYESSGTVSISGVAGGIEELIGVDSMEGDFKLNANEKRQSLTSEKLAGQLNGAPFTINLGANLDPQKAKLNPFAVSAFGGTSTLSTSLSLENTTYPFTSSLSSNGMLIEQLVPALAPDMPIAITGTIKEVGGSMSGTLDENLTQSLKGKSKVLISDGLIKDVNLGQQILGSVTDLPFIQGALLSVAPPELQSFLAKDYTVLSEISGSFVLENEVMTSDDMKVLSDFFEFEADGTIGLDTELNLDAIIHFNEAFSTEMVDEVKELRGLLDRKGRITFPVTITGIPPELSTVPDLSGILEDLVKNSVRNEVEDKIKEEIGDEGGIIDGIRGLLGGKKKKKKR